MGAKAVIVLDTLIFESLGTCDLAKVLTDDYFIVLWTTQFNDSIVSQIPYDGYINGLRNGGKPFRYLRMYLRKYHPDVLPLPVVIVDFERFYTMSRFGYDLAIDINTTVVQQTYNNRPVNTIDTKTLFTSTISMFIQQYSGPNQHVISEETIMSTNIVFSSNDLYERVNKPRIINRKCILVVAPSFFELRHNLNCTLFKEFLKNCFLVVWMDTKNITKQQLQNFTTSLRDTFNITINYMLFGLDRGCKSMTLIRRYLAPTRLPFILVDHLDKLYGGNNVLCDFDYYLNLDEYRQTTMSFYDMKAIIEMLRRYIESLDRNLQPLKRTLKIEEVDDGCTVEMPTGRTDDVNISKAICAYKRKKNKSSHE